MSEQAIENQEAAFDEQEQSILDQITALNTLNEVKVIGLRTAEREAEAAERGVNLNNVQADSVFTILQAERDRLQTIDELSAAIAGGADVNNVLRDSLNELTGAGDNNETAVQRLLRSERERQQTIVELTSAIDNNLDVNGVLANELRSLRGETDDNKDLSLIHI